MPKNGKKKYIKITFKSQPKFNINSKSGGFSQYGIGDTHKLLAFLVF